MSARSVAMVLGDPVAGVVAMRGQMDAGEHRGGPGEHPHGTWIGDDHLTEPDDLRWEAPAVTVWVGERLFIVPARA
jgi:hypothetical protein